MSSLEKPRPAVLLLGAEETPSLPLIWSLARQRVPVTVASWRRIAPGMWSRFPVKRETYPHPERETEHFVDWLESRLRSRAFPVTLGCGETITYLLSKHKARLESYTAIPVVDVETFMKCRDKSLTMKAAVECGVPVPETWFPEEEGIEAAAEKSRYPAVLKPCISNGARGISFADTPAELVRQFRKTRPVFGPCIIQERIPHEGMQYKVEVLLDREQRVHQCGAYAKLRYYPPTGGSSTLNRTLHREDILESAKRILRHLGWWGMGDCDFILDPRDGQAKLMEINPRFTRTIRVLVEAGLDFPYALYRLALGLEGLESKDYRRDVYLRYLPADLVWFLRSSERFRSRPSFFRFLGRDLYYEEWSRRDPLTGVGFWLLLLGDMLNPRARRSRLR